MSFGNFVGCSYIGPYLGIQILQHDEILLDVVLARPPGVVAPGDLDDLRVPAVQTDDALPPHEVGHVVEDVPVHLNLLLEGVRRLQELPHVLVLRLRLHDQVVLAELDTFLLM